MKEMWKQLQWVKEMNGKDEEHFKLLLQCVALSSFYFEKYKVFVILKLF